MYETKVILGQTLAFNRRSIDTQPEDEIGGLPGAIDLPGDRAKANYHCAVRQLRRTVSAPDLEWRQRGGALMLSIDKLSHVVYLVRRS